VVVANVPAVGATRPARGAGGQADRSRKADQTARSNWEVGDGSTFQKETFTGIIFFPKALDPQPDSAYQFRPYASGVAAAAPTIGPDA